MHFGPWEVAAFGGLWIGAFLLAADVGLRMSANLQARFPRLKQLQESGWWGFIPLTMLTIAGAIFLGHAVGILPERVPPTVVAPSPPIKLESDAGATPVSRRQPYRLTDNNQPVNRQTVIKAIDNKAISPDRTNDDFRAYSAWLAANNVPDSVEAILPPIYAARSPNDADREIPIVDQLYNFLQNNAKPLPEEGRLLLVWQVRLKSEENSLSYTQDLDKFFYKMNHTNDEILKIARESKYCNNDLCVIVGGARRNFLDFAKAIAELQTAFTSLSKVTDHDKYKQLLNTSAKRDISLDEMREWMNFEKILHPYAEAPKQLLVAYGVWVEWTGQLLLERRDQLSKSGSKQ